MKKGSEASKPADSLVMAVSVQQKSRVYPALLTHVLHLRTKTRYQNVVSVHVTSCGDNGQTVVVDLDRRASGGHSCTP